MEEKMQSKTANVHLNENGYNIQIEFQNKSTIVNYSDLVPESEFDEDFDETHYVETMRTIYLCAKLGATTVKWFNCDSDGNIAKYNRKTHRWNLNFFEKASIPPKQWS
jgi:hypothetical protein